LSDDEAYKTTYREQLEKLNAKNHFDFDKDSPIDIWKLILSNAQQFMREELKYSKTLSKYILSGNNEAIDKFIVEAKEWRKNTVNPFAELAKRINPILNIFHLEIKANIDFENPDEMQFISIQHKDKFTEKLDYDVWSTGTKQVVMTATPLFALDTKDTVVLFDEPERSLYPDIQRVIIKHYTDLAPEAQFFFATHSPLIASQFEPWEIVELKFNEEGKVYRELYYEGENHVDNYTIFPQYLSWGEILTNVFDLNYDGNSDFRIELLTKTVRLKKQLAKMEQEGKRGTPEYNTKMDKFIKDAQKLGWSEELRTFYEKN
jgi:AAA15 family ATPase/GTPase